MAITVRKTPKKNTEDSTDASPLPPHWSVEDLYTCNCSENMNNGHQGGLVNIHRRGMLDLLTMLLSNLTIITLHVIALTGISWSRHILRLIGPAKNLGYTVHSNKKRQLLNTERCKLVLSIYFETPTLWSRYDCHTTADQLASSPWIGKWPFKVNTATWRLAPLLLVA